MQKKRQFIHKKNFVEVIYRKPSKSQDKQMASPDVDSEKTGSEEKPENPLQEATG